MAASEMEETILIFFSVLPFHFCSVLNAHSFVNINERRKCAKMYDTIDPNGTDQATTQNMKN